MMTNRHLLIGAVALVKGKVRDDGKAMVSICDEFEPIFCEQGTLVGAPFDVVSLVVRYGITRSSPKIGRMNNRYSELEVAIELPMAEIQGLGYDDLRVQLRNATLSALIAVAEKYELPMETWRNLLSE